MRGRLKWIRLCRGIGWDKRGDVCMSDVNEELRKRIQDAVQNPNNVGEMEGADAVGTVGSAECGEMLRMWVKFREDKGKKVIDRASFQSFGCETAIAIASLATELIRGKTPEEALAMRSGELAGGLGPLPPMKIHCAELVEGALRSALEGGSSGGVGKAAEGPKMAPTLMDSMGASLNSSGAVKIVFLEPGQG